MLISISELEQLVMQNLITEYTPEEAERIKEVVMFGELSGRPSHGISRLVKGAATHGAFVEGQRDNIEYTYKSKLSTLIDGKGNPGMLTAAMGMCEVIRLAKEHSIGIVGTRGAHGSTGSLSYYLDRISQEGFIALVFMMSSPVIAPFNVKTSLFGTNPLGYAIPHRPYPILFDMSTSAITYGELMRHYREGKVLPENVAIDANGEVTTDPAKAIEGATLPFDHSYKGSGLAMMVEMLAAVWTQAGYEGLHQEHGEGNLFIALSPELLGDRQFLQNDLEEFLVKLRGTPTRDNAPVRVPGEQTLRTRDANIQKKEIEVNEDIFKKLQEQLMVN